MLDLHFRLMVPMLRIRDIVCRPAEVLRETPIRKGHVVVDYGCGSGSHALAAAEIVGKRGHVYAVDEHPLAIRMVDREISRRGLTNMSAIRTSCETGLDSASADVILLYDVLHTLTCCESVIAELHRLLATQGTLCCGDHHMMKREIEEAITRSGLFAFRGRGTRQLFFQRSRPCGAAGTDEERICV